MLWCASRRATCDIGKQHSPFAHAQVGAYAMQFRFLQLEHDEVTSRLKALERLSKQHGVASSADLLGAAAQAEADLDRWFQMEGTRMPPFAPCSFWLSGVTTPQHKGPVPASLCQALLVLRDD